MQLVSQSIHCSDQYIHDSVVNFIADFLNPQSECSVGGLLVKALDCGSKGPRVPVPLAAEIYFSSGCTQPYQKLSRRFSFSSFGGDVKPSVPGNPLKLA